MNPLRIAGLMVCIGLIALWFPQSQSATTQPAPVTKTSITTQLLEDLRTGDITQSMREHGKNAGSSSTKSTFHSPPTAGEIYSIDTNGNKHWHGAATSPVALEVHNETHLVLPNDEQSSFSLLSNLDPQIQKHIAVCELPRECLTRRIATRLPELEGLVLFGGKLNISLVEQIGSNRRLRSLTLMNVAADAASLLKLTKFSRLRQLKCIGMQLPESCMVGIGAMRNLEDLDLDDCRLPSGTLPELTNLRNLRRLSLANTAVSDDDCRLIGNLHQLISLRLERNPISNQGARELRTLKRLRTLEMKHTNIGDESISELCRLTNLQQLDMSYTRVSAAGAISIASSGLSELSLAGTAVDDSIVPKLRLNARLTKLNLDESSVSDAAVAQLREQHPNAQIY